MKLYDGLPSRGRCDGCGRETCACPVTAAERVLARLTALDEAAGHLLEARQWLGNLDRRMALGKSEFRLDDAATTAGIHVRRCREALAAALDAERKP